MFDGDDDPDQQESESDQQEPEIDQTEPQPEPVPQEPEHEPEPVPDGPKIPKLTKRVITFGRSIKEKINVEDIKQYWGTHCWKVVESFYKEHGVVQQQVDSYNLFLDESIRRIVSELPVIEVKTDECRYEFRFCPEGLTITPPDYTEQDGNIVKMYPNDARLRNLTYSSSVYCRVEIIKKYQGRAEERFSGESSKMRLIGKIPVMVRSNCCLLKNLTDQELIARNECPLDPGGYFIINGKERVIIAQERAANNTMFVFARNSDSKNIIECEIRSSVENSSASAHAFWVTIAPPRKAAKKPDTKNPRMDTPKIKARFPSLTTQIDITILFQALGFDDDYGIIKNILCLDNSAESQMENSAIAPIISRTFEVCRCSSLLDAREHMAQFIRADLNDDDKIPYMDQVLTKEFLPHLGTEPSDAPRKVFYLCQMIRKLLMVFTGFRPFDDRDHLQNKRYYFAGPMIAQTFFRGLRIMHSDMKKNLEIQVGRKKKFVIERAIVWNTVSRYMNHCISTGTWGDARRLGCRIYRAVTQELNRFTYASLISSLRRINSPEDKLHLMVKPRLLHNTYFGMICPCETPEGKSVGLVKNMAMLALISVGLSPEPIKRFLIDECGVKELMHTMVDVVQKSAIPEPPPVNPPLRRGRSRRNDILQMIEAKPTPEPRKINVHRLTKIFVNGNWVGFHDNPELLIVQLREERKCQQRKVMLHETSISWDQSVMEIDIQSDAGRFTRPLMVIADDKMKITYADIQKLEDATYGWKDLLKNGLVEMVDVRESESTLIAMSPSKLDDSRTSGYRMNYTHMEIHPSLMLGVCASLIPFADHNQSPRNVYQSGIAKQAMGVYITNYNARMDTSSHVLFYPQLQLAKTAASKYTRFNELPAGINCIVAIATQEGYNQEDSVILNRAALDRGLFRSTYYHTYQDKAERNVGKGNQNEEFHRPNKARTYGLQHGSGATEAEQMIKYIHLDKDGIVPPGVKLMDDDCVIGKTVKLPTAQPPFNSHKQESGGHTSKRFVKTHRDASTYLKKSGAGEATSTMKSSSNAIVDRCLITTAADGLRLVKVRVRNTTCPQIGDKFASLHGQKGVCGMVYREEDLMFTKDGIIPDIVINPHGLPSRMTIGQLYESIYGKSAALTGECKEPYGTTFDPRNLSNVQNILTMNAFESMGNEVMYSGFTGRKYTTQIFIGPTFYQRLKHLVDDKIHSRARGTVNILTRQPVQGFSKEGGLRFGEMERDCVISHGTSLFLMERLLDVSDLYLMPICDKCGSMVSRRPVHGIRTPYFACSLCPATRNTIEGTSTMRIPYACKLLIQELMCMHISVRIVPNKVKFTKNGLFEIQDDDYDDTISETSTSSQDFKRITEQLMATTTKTGEEGDEDAEVLDDGDDDNDSVYDHHDDHDNQNDEDLGLEDDDD